MKLNIPSVLMSCVIAWLLVRWEIPEVYNKTTSYTRGDVVTVQPDKWTPGKKEAIPPKDGGGFVRINIQDTDFEDLLILMDSDNSKADGMPLKRKYNLDIDALAGNQISDLVSKGVISIDSLTLDRVLEDR